MKRLLGLSILLVCLSTLGSLIFLSRDRTVTRTVPGPVRTVIREHTVVRWHTRTVTRTVTRPVTDPGQQRCIDALYADMNSWAVNDHHVEPMGWWDTACIPYMP